MKYSGFCLIESVFAAKNIPINRKSRLSKIFYVVLFSKWFSNLNLN